jgi:hypothetical protein
VPPSPRAEGPAVDLVLEAGAEPPTARLLVEVPAGTTEAPTGAAEVPPQPSRKRKRGFSNLRSVALLHARLQFRGAVAHPSFLLLTGGHWSSLPSRLSRCSS